MRHDDWGSGAPCRPWPVRRVRAETLEDWAMSELIGIARFKFHEGKRQEYLRLTDQATELVRATSLARWPTTCTSTAINPSA